MITTQVVKHARDVEVVTAVNGDLAVREIQKNMLQFYKYNSSKSKKPMEQPVHYDAIILDLNMPIMNGTEACKQILQIYKDFNDTQLALKEKCQNPDGTVIHDSDVICNDNQTYVNRRPLMIANSAHITEEIHQNCLAQGFDMITNIPIEQEFIAQMFAEVENRQLMHE